MKPPAAHPTTCTLRATPQTCMGAVLVQASIVTKAFFITDLGTDWLGLVLVL